MARRRRRGGWGSTPYAKKRTKSRPRTRPGYEPVPASVQQARRRGAYRPPGLAQFMAALAGQESGGRSTARNRLSGAYGTFQIMPANWGPWAQEAGLGRNAPRTARNQELVARFKLSQYYNQFGSWDAVAVAWYAGPGAAARYVRNPNDPRWRKGQRGGPSISRYVQQVMARMGDPNAVRGLRQPGAVRGPMDEKQVARVGAQIASQYGLRISSHKRSPAHNKRVGGARRSDHLTGMAIDLAGHPAKMRALAAWARANTGPGKLFRYVAYGDRAHRDHVHLSFNKAGGRGMEFDLEAGGGGSGWGQSARQSSWGRRRGASVPGEEPGMGEFDELDFSGMEGMEPDDISFIEDVMGEDAVDGEGGFSMRDLYEQAKAQAKSAFPALAEQIDRGISPEMYATPYLETAANLLEISPEEMDINDPKWKRPLHKIGPDGKPVIMPLWEWEQHLRSDPIYGWDKTGNARRHAAGLAGTILETFGYTGAGGGGRWQ